MDGISTEVRRRARTVAVITAVALVPTTGTAMAVHTAAAPSIPIVTIAMVGDTAKISGASKLAAGWVTFKVRTDKDPHNLWFYTPKPGAKKGDVAQAEKAVRKVRAGHGQGPGIDAKAPADPESPNLDKGTTNTEKKAAAAKQEKERAKSDAAAGQARTDTSMAEKTLLALGGVYVAPKRTATIVVNLPQGQVTVADLAVGKETKTVPLTVFKVGPAGKQRAPGKGAAQIFLDESSKIQAPEKLKRSGQLLINNESMSKWHFIGLQKLAKGATENDLVAWFDSPAGKRKYPFDPAYSIAAAPLSGGRTQYLSYDLPAGKYALIDAWVDSDSGRFYASQGGTRMITLK